MTSPRRALNRGLIILGIIIAGSAIGLASVMPAFAAPKVILNPTHGPNGTVVSISACGFSPYQRGLFAVQIDGVDSIVDENSFDCPDGTLGFGTGTSGTPGLGVGTSGTPVTLAIHGPPGSAHRVRVLSHPGSIAPEAGWAFADATFTIDTPIVYLPYQPTPKTLATPTPTPNFHVNLPTSTLPNIGNMVLPTISVRINGVDPNPGLPNAAETVRFTVGNDTNSDATIQIDGTAAGQRLFGRDTTAMIPAHGHAALSLSTLYHVSPGSETAFVHAALAAGTHLVPGPNGLPRSIPNIVAEASDSMAFTVQAPCVPQSRTAAAMSALIVLFEKLNGDPHLPGLTWQRLFGGSNHLDLSSFVHPSEAWEQTLVQSIWLDLKNGDGNTTTAVQGNGIHFHQEYDVHLDSIHMVWGMTTDMDAVPALGPDWMTTPQNYHLSLQVPDGDNAALGFLTGGAWLAGKPALESYLQGVSADQVGTPVANGIAAELGLPGFFPAMDGANRPRAGFSMAAPEMNVNYCFAGL